MAVVVWREEPPKGEGNTILEMALGARKIMCLPEYQPHTCWFFQKKNCSFLFLSAVGRAQGRAEETALDCPCMITSSVWGPLLCQGVGEELWMLVGTNTVTPQCSLPRANWKWPVESYRSLSVWGASSWRRTHRFWGVQFISRGPGRQILHGEQILLTPPCPEPWGPVVHISSPSTPQKNQTLPWEKQNETTRRKMEPNSSSVLSFSGYKFVPFGKYNSRFVIAVSLVVLLFLGTWIWLSWSGGSKEIYLRAAGCSRQRDMKSFKLKTKDSSHSGACILAPEKLYCFWHRCYLE